MSEQQHIKRAENVSPARMLGAVESSIKEQRRAVIGQMNWSKYETWLGRRGLYDVLFKKYIQLMSFVSLIMGFLYPI